MRGRVVSAIFKRELLGYFSSPTGYVFITIFVFLSAIAAFWQEDFFAANLANLDQLNRFFPYLLVFLVPAITMSLWAEEKRYGTDELVLTLPASDVDIVLGKYLAALAIYTVALLFSLSNVIVLFWLGNPDLGMLASTYLGYWLMGAALLSLGLFASLLTDNLTVAFILGALFCAVPVFIHHAGVILSGEWQNLAQRLSMAEQFQDLAAGIVTPAALLYFLSFAAAFLYLNIGLLGRRHWPTGRRSPNLGIHYLVRGLCLLVIVASISLLGAHLTSRIDVTSEKVHSLSPDTVNLLKKLDPGKPVIIEAYLSPQVPRSYMQVRANLVRMLREFDEIGGEAVHKKIYETEKYSAEAREAQERFSIRASAVPVTEETVGAPREIFLGVAFTCGSEEFVIPFFDRGLPVEYELMRSIRVVSKTERKQVGVLNTGVKLFGGFDFKTNRQDNEWPILAELRKQYEVTQVQADTDYPTNVDAMLVVLPHTLTPPQLDRLIAYVKQGRPVLLLVDPLPAFSIDSSPQDVPSSPFQQAPPKTRTDVTPLLELLGVSWPTGDISWDKYNPHPQLSNLPPEVVFVGSGNGAKAAFNASESIASSLQEVVLIYPGTVVPSGSAKTKFFPLLQTGTASGLVPWNRLVQQSFFGISLAQGVSHEPDKGNHVLAARVEGSGSKPVKAVVVADCDLLGEQFFELRKRGIENLNFDNVTFMLNAVDYLVGDQSFIALRKRRPRHRTLEAVEAKTRVYEEQRLKETRLAESTASKRLDEAQKRLDRAVEDLRRRPDLDEQTRDIMINNLQSVENRRLTVSRANIEDEKQRQIEDSRANMEAAVRGIQNMIKLLAVALPPIPAFSLFLLFSLKRLRSERIGVSERRLLSHGAVPQE
ncbi:MAG: ABC transporter [Acidobacteria bacterium]|nr:MAG: ABC transporter [Acidobacteriota bacterium]